MQADADLGANRDLPIEARRHSHIICISNWPPRCKAEVGTRMPSVRLVLSRDEAAVSDGSRAVGHRICGIDEDNAVHTAKKQQPSEG